MTDDSFPQQFRGSGPPKLLWKPSGWADRWHTGAVAELTLGSLNLHMGRGTGGHDAPFYDVVAACKEIDTDVLVLQEGWVPDDAEGDVLAVAGALGYQVAATFAVARAEGHDQVRLVARARPAGAGRPAVRRARPPFVFHPATAPRRGGRGNPPDRKGGRRVFFFFGRVET